MFSTWQLFFVFKWIFYLSIYVRHMCDHKPMTNRFGRYSYLYGGYFGCSCSMNCHRCVCADDPVSWIGCAIGNENVTVTGTSSDYFFAHYDCDVGPFHLDNDDACLNKSITGQITNPSIFDSIAIIMFTRNKNHVKGCVCLFVFFFLILQIHCSQLMVYI